MPLGDLEKEDIGGFVGFLNDAGASTDTFFMEPEYALSAVLGW